MRIQAPTPAQLRRRSGRKWRQHGDQVIPAWVADMDFLPAPPIRASLQEALDIGDLGYGRPAAQTGAPEAFAAWTQRRWGWAIDSACVMLSPDVVSGLYNAIEALTAPGDPVLVQTPIYPSLMGAVRSLGRRLVEHPVRDDGDLDLEGLERTIAREGVRMLLLCNPHNPSGRVFTMDEVCEIGRIAQAHDLVVVADEVHADLAYPGHRHVPFASLSPAIAARTVTVNSPSKAFNVAGLRLAVCVASEPEMRRRLQALPAPRWTPFSTLGVRAALAAWSEEGEAWLKACVARLQANRDRIAARLPAGVRYRPPEASYLAWLDFRDLGLRSDPAAFLLEHAKVALSPGPEFGGPGAGFARLNFATSEEILDEILDRIEAALS
jgi:cystathionine beta-lyase